MNKTSTILGAVVLNFFGGAKAADVTLRPVAPNPTETYQVSKPKSAAIGFYMNSIFPFASPYENTQGGEKYFRFQTPLQFGFEFGYAFSPKFEAALNAGYENFETRAETSSGSVKEYQKLRVKSYPVGGFFRYKFSNNDISPELEMGGAYAFGKIYLDSTNLSAKPSSETLNSYRFYGAGGAGLAWTESLTLHASLGYAYVGWGEKTYGTVGTFTGAKQSSMHGVFAKSTVRFTF